MQYTKKLVNIVAIATATVCSIFSVANAETIKQVSEQKEHFTLISKSSATDKVYLTMASNVADYGIVRTYHYSHRSHSSHSSHYSHRSHYSSY